MLGAWSEQVCLPGGGYADALTTAIQQCHVFLPIITSEYLDVDRMWGRLQAPGVTPAPRPPWRVPYIVSSILGAVYCFVLRCVIRCVVVSGGSGRLDVNRTIPLCRR